MMFQFNTAIASITGNGDEAAFVHHIWYWVVWNRAREKNLRDGKYWTYSSLQDFCKDGLFDYLTPRQIERIIRNCVAKGLIETACYNEDGRDQTKWYTVTDLVLCIYANGEMQSTECVDTFHQTVKCIKGTDKRPDKRNTDILPLFDRFWGAYPRKVSKADARKAFAKLNPDAALVEDMLRALDWQKRLPEWTKDGGQFIPYPATWLNARRWEDEPEGSPTPPTPPERKEDEYTWL